LIINAKYLLIVVFLLASLRPVLGGTILKAGFVVNKGDEKSYSWVIIHETDYFIKNMISIGYETQFSYYKVKSTFMGTEYNNNAFPLNVFFNSKVKIVRKGIVRPYVGAGFGLLTNIINYPQEFAIEKYSAYHLMGGVNIGKISSAAFQIEFRLLNSSKEDSNTKLLIVCGIQY